MNCPLCQKPITTIICPSCDQAGDQAAWLRLHQLAFIRQEIAGWSRLGRHLQTTLGRHYEEAQHALEISLRLRQAPPTVAEAQALEQELAAVRLWLFCLTSWEKRGWLTAGFARRERSLAERQSNALLARLHQAPYWPIVTPRQRKQRDLDNSVQFLERVEIFLADGQIGPDQGHAIHSWLKGEIATMQQELEPPAKLPTNILRRAQIRTAPMPNPNPAPKPANTIPWTWDRIWETLLSERTLQAILFLGALLVVAAGISWVAWNWETFSPPLQVGILATGTAAFFATGWYVHNRLALHGSGIALLGVGALLVPLDIYALFLSGLFPAGAFPWIWLVGSATCLVLYFLVGRQLQAPFFGYLLAAAAGSLAVATLNLWPGQLVYWSPVTMAVALLLVLAGWQLSQASSQQRAAFLSAPFFHSALSWAAAVLLVGTVYEAVDGGYRPDDLILLSLNFALGAMIFAGGRSRYRWLSLLGVALLCLPLAGLWLGLWLAHQAPAAGPWLGPVWAGLTVTYLLAAWCWPSLSTPERRMFNILAALLGPAALAWGLGDLLAATYSLLILASIGPLLARARARASWLWLLTLGLLAAGATYQGHHGVAAAALALPWALLASLLFASAIIIRQLRQSERTTLAQGSLLAAFLAILPPVALADRSLMIYAVANWCGIALWHILQPPLSHNNRTAAIAHWGLAGGILLELWFLATRSGLPQAQTLALAYAILAWSYLALSRLRHGQGAWRYLGLVALSVSLWLSLSESLSFTRLGASFFLWQTVLLYNGAIYSLAYGWRFGRRSWLYLAGMLYGAAAIPILFFYLGDASVALMSLGLLPAGSLIMLLYFSQAPVRQWWLKPLALAWLHQALLLLPLMSLILLLADTDMVLPMATGISGLGLTFLAYGWFSGKERWAHLGIWTGLVAGAAVIRYYSHGTGRSAALAALLAILLITSERMLQRLTQQSGRLYWQRCWLLYRRPLALAGWLVAAGAALAALGRNLLWLGGGPTQLTWSIVTLALLTLLLFAAAHAYSKPALAWPGCLTLAVSWTLLTYRLLPKALPDFYAWFGVSWLLLALALEQATGGRRDADSWHYPTALLAHLLAPAGILAGLLGGADLGALLWPINPYTVAGSLTLVLAAFFYFRTYRRKATAASGLVGLYLAVCLSEGWLFLTPRALWPGFAWVNQGLTLLVSTIPLLWLARRLGRASPRAATVFYHLSVVVGLLALPILGANRWLQGAALYYLAGLAILATVWHRQPRWLYAAGIASTLAHGVLLEQLNGLTFPAIAWSQLGWAAILVVTGRFLQQHRQPRYETPLLATALALLGLALLPALIASSPTRQLSLIAIALLLAVIAYWQHGPLYLYAAVPIGFLAYMLGLEWFPTGWRYLHLYALPAALIVWRGARWLDNHIKPALGQKPPPYLWDNPVGWWAATGERLLSWWSLPFYLLTTAILLVSSFLTPVRWHGLIPLALSALVWGTFYRRTALRIWLFAFAFWSQWLVYGLIKLWLPTSTVAGQLLATGPVALLLLWAAARIGRRAPWGTPAFWRSPALPLWLLLGLDLVILQAFGTTSNYTGIALTMLNSAILGIWACVWHRPVLTYGSLSLLAVALWQFCWAAQFDAAPTVAIMALFALCLASLGHSWLLLRRQELAPPAWLALWAPAARQLGRLLGGATLLATLVLLPETFLNPSLGPHLSQRYLILSLAQGGVLWLVVATAYQRVRLAYAALLLILGAWLLAARWWLPWQDNQLFAGPAGAYLLAISWLEWTYGERRLALWLERAGLLLLVGSAFWQSFGPWGGLYALLMIVEGLLLVWLGSWRRLRRLLYAGVLTVILAVAGQLVEPLLALNSFVLLLLGAGLVGLGIALERRLEKLRGFSQEVRQLMESWE